MGGISSSVGLVSGIDTATLIEQLLLIEAQPKIPLERRLSTLQAQRTALLDINARLLSLQSVSKSLRTGEVFAATLATSSDEERLLATTGNKAQPGQYKLCQRVRSYREGMRIARRRRSGCRTLGSSSGRRGWGRIVRLKI